MDTFPTFVTLVVATHLSILYHNAESQQFTKNKDKEGLTIYISVPCIHAFQHTAFLIR